jgi:hypothetical protein
MEEGLQEWSGFWKMLQGTLVLIPKYNGLPYVDFPMTQFCDFKNLWLQPSGCFLRAFAGPQGCPEFNSQDTATVSLAASS